MGFLTDPVFWLYFVLVNAGIGLVLWVLSFFVASYFVYTKTLKRGSRDKWSRELPKDLPPEQELMYNAGLLWAEENKEHKTDVHIVNKGLNLYGEYYDFGSKKCVIVLSGRTETLKYGYYFGIPYVKNGYNLLVLDPRGHGLSDGEYNTVGFEESGDAIAWVKHIKDNFGVESVIFHGICIGAAGGMLAITNEECPDIVHGIVTEGMFSNFRESVKNHMIEQKKSTFVVLDMVDKWMKHYTGHSMKYGPIDVIDKLDKPLLMLHSKEDLYSTPYYAEKLYDKAGTRDKRLVWFEHGKHSMLRITDTNRYDTAITEFLAELPSNKIIKEREYVL